MSRLTALFALFLLLGHNSNCPPFAIRNKPRLSHSNRRPHASSGLRYSFRCRIYEQWTQYLIAEYVYEPCSVIGIKYFDIEQYDKSIWPLKKSIQWLRHMQSETTPEQLDLRARLAFAYAIIEDYDAAVAEAKNTLGLFEQIQQTDARALIYPMVMCKLTLGRVAFRKGQLNESKTLSKEVMELTCFRCPSAYLLAGRELALAEAMTDSKAALQTSTKIFAKALECFGESDFTTMLARHNLAKRYLEISSQREVIRLAKRNYTENSTLARLAGLQLAGDR